MSQPMVKFKYWDRVQKFNAVNLPPSSLTPVSASSPDDQDDLQWNYVAFTPSSDPKHNNGTKATTLRFKNTASIATKRARRTSNTSTGTATTSKTARTAIKPAATRTRTRTSTAKRQRPASMSLSDNDSAIVKAARHSTAIPNSTRKTTLPLLCYDFQLKYIVSGHAHLAPRIKKKSKKKATKGKNDKTGGKGKRHQRVKNSMAAAAEEDEIEDEEEDDEDDEEEEEGLDIWACEFEPSSSNLVAVCGGNHILFVDAQQGRHVKKYTHPEPLECFYTLAWTLLCGSEQLGKNKMLTDTESAEQDEEISATILAAAGKFGSIKLFEPTQTHCYRYLFGHQQAVLKLNFSKREPRWLLSASMDNTVRLWDIGIPNNEIDDSCCLAQFTVPKASHPTSMSLSFDLSLLVVGTSNADLLQYAIRPDHIDKWKRQRSYHSSTTDNSKDDDDDDDDDDNDNDDDGNNNKKKNDDGDKKPYTATTLKVSSRFPHGQEWHEGYVEDVYILGQDGDDNELNGYVVSRSSEDIEVLIWNPETSTKTDSDIFLSLNWPETDDCTGLRFSIVEKEGQKLYLGGDAEGDIHLFNIGDGKFSKTLKDGSKQVFDPLKIFSHEGSTELIRDVCVSEDTRKFVAVDSNNTIFIWSCD